MTHRQRLFLKKIGKVERLKLKSDEIEYNEKGEPIWFDDMTENEKLERALSVHPSSANNIEGDDLFLLYRDYYRCDLSALVRRFKGELSSSRCSIK